MNSQHVALLDLDVNNGKALETELASKHGMDKVFFYKCDVTSDDLHSAYDSVLKKFGYIDVVVNNAGILNDSPKAYEKMIAVNLVSNVRKDLRRKSKVICFHSKIKGQKHPHGN